MVPLSGGASVESDGQTLRPGGPGRRFAGPTDFVYLPDGQTATLALGAAAAGSRSAAPAPTTSLPPRYLPAAEVPVELRGAGQSSRQVRNFGTPEPLAGRAIIACEVITPGGNWSSYPAHKHDEATRARVRAGGDLLLRDRRRTGRRTRPGLLSGPPPHPATTIDILEEVRDRDTVLVPYGWHGPAVAAPGHDMYYLNVMAGPGAGAGLEDLRPPRPGLGPRTWADQPIDPRLTGEDSPA